jgi:4-amino-4-deoxy-L-arabinose transferase-like glycosyltransferase
VIGLIFPGFAVGAFVAITRDWRLLRRLELARGGALFLAIALPWHVLMERNFPGFLRYYLVDKHVYRFLGHPELLSTVSLPVPTYLAMTLAWFCPWSAFLPAAIRRCSGVRFSSCCGPARSSASLRSARRDWNITRCPPCPPSRSASGACGGANSIRRGSRRRPAGSGSPGWD